MNNFLLLGLLLSVVACQSKQESSTRQALAPQEMAAMKAPSPEQDAPPSAQELAPESPQPSPVSPATTATRQLVRQAQLRIRVTDFRASGQAIERAVQQAGGQITSSNETKTDNSIENALTIRMPVNRFDALLAAVLKESIFTDTKTLTTDDVTRQYVDVEARIRSKKAVEATYLNLLKQARNVGEVLKVEEQLAAIREEREVQEAELRHLKDEVTRSTINLTYYQQTEVALNPEEPFYTQIGHNLTDGFRLISDVLIGLFYFLPLGLVGGGVAWLILRWRRRNTPK